MSIREPKEDKKPRKGIVTGILDPVPVDPFGNDYFNTLNDINDVINNEGFGSKDKVVIRQYDADNTGQKDPSKRTNRRGSMTRPVSKDINGPETVILEPGINNALERLKNNDPNAFNTDILDNIKSEVAKVARIQDNDPVMKEGRERLSLANALGLMALNTELLGQMLQTQQQILIELREDRRIRTYEEKIEGKNVVAEFTLPVATGVIRFDFSDLESFIGPTSIKNTLQNFASKKIFSIQIVVNSGGPLKVAPNEDDFQRTYVPVTTTYEMTCDKATINTLNVRATVDATVTLIGTY